MKKINKIVSCIVVIAIIITLGISVFATDSFSVSSKDVTATVGEDVIVTVSIDSNPGVVAFQLNVDYDAQIFTLKSAEKGDALTKFDYTVFNTSKTPISIGGVENIEANVAADTANNKETGVIATLVFDVAENAKEGQYPIDITITRCVNYQNDSVFTSVDSSVVVLKNEDEHKHDYKASVTAPTCIEKGYTTYTCACGDTYKDSFVSETGEHTDNDSNNKCDVCNTDIPKIPTTGGDPIKYSLGDVDGNGKITAKDARSILRCSASLEIFSDEQKDAADIDRDGKVKASDARIALRISASLESIDKYLSSGSNTDEPSTNDPDTKEPETDDPVETINAEMFIGMIIDDVLELYPDFETEGDGTYNYAGITLETDSIGMVYDILVSKSDKAEMYGLKPGVSAQETVSVLEECGFEIDLDYLMGYDEINDIEVCIFTDESNIVTYINIWIEPSVLSTDLINYYFSDLESIQDELGVEPELMEDTDCWYDCGGFNVGVDFEAYDEGKIVYIEITDYSDYNICGVTVGMDLVDAVEILETNFDVVFDGYGDIRVLNYSTGDYFCAFVDENNEIYYVAIYEDWIDLGNYISCELDSFLYLFPDAEYDEENDLYFNDYLFFYTDEYGNVYDITLDSDSYMCVYGVYIGMDADIAIDMLEDRGFVMEDFSCGYNESYDEYVFVTYSEEDYVESVCIYYIPATIDYENYDLSVYLGAHYDDICSMIPFESTEGVYEMFGNNGFCFDDDHLVVDMKIIGESEYNILGVEYGMDYEFAIEILQDAGYDIDIDSTFGDNYDNDTFVIVTEEDGLVSSIALAYN